MANSQVPVNIPYRPFGICPATNLMNPDGFFVVNMDRQYIEAFFQNQGTSAFNNTKIYIESLSDIGIQLLFPGVLDLGTVPPGASIPVRFQASFKNATPGISYISFIVQADGYTYKRVIKKIFVTRITYDKPTKTYGVEAPEGTLLIKVHKAVIGPRVDCCGKDSKVYCCMPPQKKKDGKCPFIVLPTDVTCTLIPASPYSGIHGPYAFEDPAWKVIAGILGGLCALAGLLYDYFSDGELDGGVVSVSGTFDETEPSIDACPSPDLCVDIDAESDEGDWVVRGLYGAAGTLISIAIASDGPDPMFRGQEATPPATGELTTMEKVHIKIQYPVPPSPGTSYPITGEWVYTRVTTGNVYTFEAKDERKNLHYAKEYSVEVPTTVNRYHEPIIIKARFVKPDDSIYKGHELYVSALLIDPNGIGRWLELHDDGIKPDEQANDGIYTGWYRFRQEAKAVARIPGDPAGTWYLYVFAQDVNLVTPDMKPQEASYVIGGLVLTNQLKLNFARLCQLTPDAAINVV